MSARQIGIRALLVSGLAAGCAHLVPTAPAGSTPGASQADTSSDSEGRNPKGPDIARMLKQSGLDFETVTPDQRWKLSFTGHHHPVVEVFVLYSDNFTVVLGRLCTLKADASVDVYKTIAQRNFDLEQIKLSVDKDGEVYASFEVPTRILDKRELLENIASLAQALDEMTLDGTNAVSPDSTPATPESPDTPDLNDPGNPVVPIRAHTQPISTLEQRL